MAEDDGVFARHDHSFFVAPTFAEDSEVKIYLSAYQTKLVHLKLSRGIQRFDDPLQSERSICLSLNSGTLSALHAEFVLLSGEPECEGFQACPV